MKDFLQCPPPDQNAGFFFFLLVFGREKPNSPPLLNSVPDVISIYVQSCPPNKGKRGNGSSYQPPPYLHPPAPSTKAGSNGHSVNAHNQFSPLVTSGDIPKDWLHPSRVNRWSPIPERLGLALVKGNLDARRPRKEATKPLDPIP